MDLRSFRKNTIIYGFGSVVLRFGGLILVPLYTHFLLPTEYGLLITILITVEIMCLLMGLQMSPAFLRYFEEYYKENKLGELVGTSCVTVVAGCTIVTLISLYALPILFGWIKSESEFIKYLWPICLFSAAKSLHMHAVTYYRAKNDALKFIICNVLTTLGVVIISIVILVKYRFGIRALIFAQFSVYLIVAVIIYNLIFRKTQPSFSYEILPKILNFGIPIIFSAVSWFVMESSDNYFLAHYRGFDVVAIYGLGYKAASLLTAFVVIPFQQAYGPFTFAIIGEPGSKEKIGRIFCYLIISLLVVGVCLVIFGPFVVRILAPPEYNSAYSVMLCILPVGIMVGIYYWASALVHIVKKTYWISLIMVLASSINLMMNYLLIPRLGWFGAALSTNISFFVAAVGVYFIGMYLYPVPIRKEANHVFKNIPSTIINIYKSLNEYLCRKLA